MPERRIFSLGALLGWVVRDSVFLVLVLVVLVVLVLVGRGGANRRDPSCLRTDGTTRGYTPRKASLRTDETTMDFHGPLWMSMDFPWISHGFPMDVLRLSMDFHGFP